MKLYLIRHGEPLPEAVDPEKPLSSKGISDVKQTAEALKKNETVIKTIFHSNKKRAVQTAQILADVLGPGCALIQREDLSPNDSVVQVAKEISAWEDDTVIAGHLPFLAKLAAKLIRDPEDKKLLDFKQGVAICLAKQSGAWKVQRAITPDLV